MATRMNEISYSKYHQSSCIFVESPPPPPIVNLWSMTGFSLHSLRLSGGHERVKTGIYTHGLPAGGSQSLGSSGLPAHPVQGENHHRSTFEEKNSAASRGWRPAELFSLPDCHAVNKCRHERGPTHRHKEGIGLKGHFYCPLSEQTLLM